MLSDWTDPVLRIESVDRLSWGAQTCRVKARDYSALAFRVRGEAVIRTGEGAVRAGTGDLLYLPRGVDYDAEYTDTEILVIHFVTAGKDRAVEVCRPADPERFHRRFLSALGLWQNRGAGASALVMAELYRVLGEAALSAGEKGPPAAFTEAVKLIHARFREPGLYVGEVCRAAGLGETRFRALFSQYYQKSPVAYLTELRLEYARALLAGGRTVEEAAGSSGFRDPKYFARVVKKTWGCTPRDLRSYGK